MKRNSSGEVIDLDHPLIGFNREVLIVQKWSVLRQDFLETLQSEKQIVWQEPNKLWRHCQEALGKWILSQAARAGSVVDMKHYHFFPSFPVISTFPGQATYEEQLIRDLSIKSNGIEDSAVAALIAKLVRAFNLGKRCAEAAEDIEAIVKHLRLPTVARPKLRKVEEGDPSRTTSQKRVKGALAEISVEWPSSWRRERTKHCPPAFIPWAAYLKLQHSFRYFSSSQAETYASSTLAAEEVFLCRAAAVVLRYEGGLATGSLQLCADTSLKQHLHARGYKVMDLCASPINAYMGVPSASTFAASQGVAQSSLEREQERPNHFCSAFYDVDVYFGSLGSALRVDPMEVYHDAVVNPGKAPLLLTYDVPYDEDLCELMFTKLIADMEKADKHPKKTVIDYVLVLPLWWNIKLPIPKTFFHNGKVDSTTEGAERLSIIIKEKTAVLKKGYLVPYQWPTKLGEACPLGGRHSACFDGVFAGEGYRYFCTSTNRWLEGVTTTEVIGIASAPSEGSTASLASALKEFYAC